jgi:nitric oxide reductase large subunit
MLKRAALVALLLILAVVEIYVCAVLLPFRGHIYTVALVSDAFLLPAIFLSCTLVALGVVSFVSPEALQAYALRQNSKWFPTNPFLEWMNTANYIRFLRFTGIVVYSAGLFAAYVLIKRLGETAFI